MGTGLQQVPATAFTTASALVASRVLKPRTRRSPSPRFQLEKMGDRGTVMQGQSRPPVIARELPLNGEVTPF